MMNLPEPPRIGFESNLIHSGFEEIGLIRRISQDSDSNSSNSSKIEAVRIRFSRKKRLKSILIPIHDTLSKD